MAPKTWTATDVEMGKLTLYPRGSKIGIDRTYRFVDADDEIITEIAPGSVTEELAFVDLPQNIQDALIAINSWTKQRALEQEGMI